MKEKISTSSLLISKWLNLIVFVILDFMTVAVIMLVTIEYVGTSSDISNVFGFSVSTVIDLSTEWWILPTLWAFTIIIRFLILFISVQRNFRSKNITCLYDDRTPYQIPMAAQVSLFSLGIPVEDVHQMILQYVKIYGLKIDRVYVNISGLPNAFTIMVPIPFYKRRIVVLNSSILRLLSKEEIKASFIQEVAHMKSSNSSLKTIFTGPRVFLQFMYYYVYLRIFLSSLQFLNNGNLLESDFFYFGLGIAFLVVVYIVFRLLELISLGFLQRSNRSSELIADIVMVNTCGKNSSINMLIKLGLRLSTIYTFFEEVKWLNKQEQNPLLPSSLLGREQHIPKRKFIYGILDYFPVDLLNPIEAREKTIPIFLRWKLSQLRKSYDITFTNLQIKGAASEAAKSLNEKRINSKEYTKSYAYTLQKLLENKRIALPKIKPGQLLTNKEIEVFVNILKKHRFIEIFQDEFMSSGIQNHPRLERRILRIWNLKRDTKST